MRSTKHFCSSSLWTCLHDMVTLPIKSPILAWARALNLERVQMVYLCSLKGWHRVFGSSTSVY